MVSVGVGAKINGAELQYSSPDSHCMPLCFSSRLHILHYTTQLRLFSSQTPDNIDPAKTRHGPDAGSMLGQRRRRWPSIDPALGP